MAALSGKGIEAKVTVQNPRDIFDESQSRALIEVDNDKLQEFATLAADLGLSVEVIGKVGGDKVSINDVEISMEKLQDVYYGTFKRTIEQDL